MKSILLALLWAAPFSVACTATEAIPLEVDSETRVGSWDEPLVSPRNTLPSSPRVIVSADSALVHMVTPRFPREMRLFGQPGFVRLEVMVADDGRVLEASVLQASRDPFAREALRAVQQWQFVPAATPQANGYRIVRVPIEFIIFRQIR